MQKVCLFVYFVNILKRLSLQIGYERHWLHFLKEFIVPVNTRLYPGYHSEVRINRRRCNIHCTVYAHTVLQLEKSVGTHTASKRMSPLQLKANICVEFMKIV